MAPCVTACLPLRKADQLICESRNVGLREGLIVGSVNVLSSLCCRIVAWPWWAEQTLLIQRPISVYSGVDGRVTILGQIAGYIAHTKLLELVLI
jgi:hypothetical protein